MKYTRKGNKKTERETVLETLELLEKEGIDVSEIATRRKFNGERRFILLKEIRDDRISDLIVKYNLDPNMRVGQQIQIMRQKSDSFTEVDQKRILRLGIKKHEKPLDQQSRAFKNQIEEALYILEELKEEGVDIPLIPQTINGKLSTLSDIDSPKTMAIIKKLGLKPEYPIGSKMRTISWEYSGRKQDYHFEEKERKRTESLGFLNNIETNVEQTLTMLEQLAELGIDISSANEDITLKDGTTRRRYIYEIEDENIDSAIEQLHIPKYTLIGQRIAQAQRTLYIEEVYDQKFKDTTRDRLIKLGIKQNTEEIDINKTLEVLRALEQLGINTASIPATTGAEQIKTLISDVKVDNLEEFLEQLGIQSDFPLGKGISKISRFYNDGSYKDRTDLTDEEKKQIQIFGLARQKEKEKTAVKETIRLIKRLETYGIDINTVSLRPLKDGHQTSMILSDLDLTPEQLQDIVEEFELDEDFPLGNRIINIKQAYLGRGRVAINDEDRKDIEEIGLVNPKRSQGKQNINETRIKMFQLLRDEGIDVGSFSAYYRENGKQKTTSLGMLGLSPETLERIAEEFGVDESFSIGNWKTGLRKAYKDGKLTDTQKGQVEDLEIISELDKLDMEQKALEEKIKEIEQFKAQVKAKSKGKNQSSIGGLDE